MIEFGQVVVDRFPCVWGCLRHNRKSGKDARYSDPLVQCYCCGTEKKLCQFFHGLTDETRWICDGCRDKGGGKPHRLVKEMRGQTTADLPFPHHILFRVEDKERAEAFRKVLGQELSKIPNKPELARIRHVKEDRFFWPEYWAVGGWVTEKGLVALESVYSTRRPGWFVSSENL